MITKSVINVKVLMKPCSLNPPIDCIGLYLHCTSELFVLCFAPNYQGKSLPHENQPGNTPDQQVCFISIRIQIWLTNLAKVWRTTTLLFFWDPNSNTAQSLIYVCLGEDPKKAMWRRTEARNVTLQQDGVTLGAIPCEGNRFNNWDVDINCF